MKKRTRFQKIMEGRWGWLWGVLLLAAVSVIVKSITSLPGYAPYVGGLLLFGIAWYVGGEAK